MDWEGDLSAVMSICNYNKCGLIKSNIGLEKIKGRTRLYQSKQARSNALRETKQRAAENTFPKDCDSDWSNCMDRGNSHRIRSEGEQILGQHLEGMRQL